MATRRRDMGSSDIRARLGIEEAPEPEVIPEVSEESAAAGSPSSQGSDEGGRAEQAAPVAGGVPPTASAEAFAHENYAEAVAPPEDAPVEAAVDDWRDEEVVVAPAGPGKKIALMAGGIALALGLGAGLAIGKVSEANRAVNIQTEQAQSLEEPVNKAASRLAALAAELDTMSLERFNSDFDDRIAQDFLPGNSLVISPSTLNGSRMVLADGDAGPAVTDLVSNLQTLDAMVKRHAILTERDRPDIERELAGNQDKANYAVIFDVKESQRRYGEHMENPSDSGFMPVSGVRVTLPDNLDVVEQNSDYFYQIRLPNGQNTMVPIYAVISLPREQLVAASSTETAITRYVARVAQIKEAVDLNVTVANRAQRAVEAVAQRGSRFGF